MLICQNAEGVHGQGKVGNTWSGWTVQRCSVLANDMNDKWKNKNYTAIEMKAQNCVGNALKSKCFECAISETISLAVKNVLLHIDLDKILVSFTKAQTSMFFHYFRIWPGQRWHFAIKIAKNEISCISTKPAVAKKRHSFALCKELKLAGKFSCPEYIAEIKWNLLLCRQFVAVGIARCTVIKTSAHNYLATDVRQLWRIMVPTVDTRSRFLKNAKTNFELLRLSRTWVFCNILGSCLGSLLIGA